MSNWLGGLFLSWMKVLTCKSGDLDESWLFTVWPLGMEFSLWACLSVYICGGVLARVSYGLDLGCLPRALCVGKWLDHGDIILISRSFHWLIFDLMLGSGAVTWKSIFSFVVCFLAFVGSFPCSSPSSTLSLCLSYSDMDWGFGNCEPK